MERSKILIVDIETSGFNYIKDVIFEIGLVELDLETGIITTLFDSLVRESHLCARHRTAWIFENSDMTIEAVREAPTMDEIGDKIQAIFDQYQGMTAFNRDFDFGFLRNRNFKLPTDLACPMKLSTDILKLPNKSGYSGYKWPKVEEAYKYFFPESEYVEKHRGCDDSIHEAKIVYELYKIGVFKI